MPSHPLPWHVEDGVLDEAEHHRNEIASLRAQIESGAAMLADVRAQLAEEHRRWSKLRAHVTWMTGITTTVNAGTAFLAICEDMDRIRRETVRDVGMIDGAPWTPVVTDTGAAVEKLVTALHLYNGYKIDSRGPYGCLLDAIEELDSGGGEDAEGGTPRRTMAGALRRRRRARGGDHARLTALCRSAALGHPYGSGNLERGRHRRRD